MKELESKPLVTIGIPVYNNASTIRQAIRSVLNQTYKNFELIIINDGSTDSSFEIISEITDSRIIFIHDLANKGLIARLNQISLLAQGNLIARMDGDDVMFPTRIEQQVQFFIQNPSTDVLDTTIISIDNHNKICGIRNNFEISGSPIDFLKNCMISHPAVMYRKEWISKYKYDSDYYRAEDYELWIRSYANTVFKRLCEPLMFLREGNVSLKNYLATGRTNRLIFRRYGIDMIGKSRTNILIFNSYIKCIVYYLFSTARIQFILTGMRNKTLSKKNSFDYQSILNKISNFIG